MSSKIDFISMSRTKCYQRPTVVEEQDESYTTVEFVEDQANALFTEAPAAEELKLKEEPLYIKSRENIASFRAEIDGVKRTYLNTFHNGLGELQKIVNTLYFRRQNTNNATSYQLKVLQPLQEFSEKLTERVQREVEQVLIQIASVLRIFETQLPSFLSRAEISKMEVETRQKVENLWINGLKSKNLCIVQDFQASYMPLYSLFTDVQLPHKFIRAWKAADHFLGRMLGLPEDILQLLELDRERLLGAQMPLNSHIRTTYTTS